MIVRIDGRRLLFVIAILAAGCRRAPAAVIPTDAAACQAAGGTWREASAIQTRHLCDLPAPDAGMECTDGSDCTSSVCVAKKEGPGKGACFQRSTSLGHCIRFMNHGVG